ncbi:MAG TPA: PPC domain-containing protein [Pirellulaceae bacterium]|jgi:hypothetical protein|nr:PPC domain-containing protein [Pirellulaceae bacterium]
MSRCSLRFIYSLHISSAAVFLTLALPGVVRSQDIDDSGELCKYPRLEPRQPFPSLNPERLSVANDQEPNNDIGSAQKIPLGFEQDEDQDVDAEGEISQPFDIDVYSFDAKVGETLGAAVLAIDNRQLDSLLAVLDADGTVLHENDDHGGAAGLYPPESPFPAGGLQRDSGLTFAIPKDGTYYLRIKGTGAATGAYFAQFRLRQAPGRSLPVGSQQILFLDFDGASGINAAEMFGAGGRASADLSPFGNFVTKWGLNANRRDSLIDKIVAEVQAHFDELTMGTTSAITIQNSKDHPDPFGDPLVSRVIIGGTIAELGISTIGIAEYVDPANFSTDDTAVVLLDLLSISDSSDPGWPNSILSLPRDPSLSAEDAVARVVAGVVTHEAAHFLGCWHTHNLNATVSLPDRGGRLPNLAGVGPDGKLGTADDSHLTLGDDIYSIPEGFATASHIQNVRALVLAALSPGTSTQESSDLAQQLAGFRALQESGLREFRFGPADTRELLGLARQDDQGQAKEASRIEKAVQAYEEQLELFNKQ